jgi:nuclear protein localization family protein 4
VDGQIQDFNALASYLNQFNESTPFLDIVSDFHFLLYIATMEFVNIRDYMGPLYEAIRTADAAKAHDWRKSEVWGTVESLVEASITPALASDPTATGSNNRQQPLVAPQSVWTCNQCTYINHNSGPNCEVCQLPRA